MLRHLNTEDLLMIFDKPLLDLLEKHVTHPIQRRYSYTNFAIARWVISALLVTFLLALFGIIPVNPEVYDHLFTNLNWFARVGITITCGVGIYMVFRDIPREERRLLSAVETKTMNSRKVNLAWQYLRFHYFFMNILFISFILLWFELSSSLLSSVLILATFSLFMALSIYLLCLDPLPRSKEDVKIPIGTQIIEA